MANGAPAKPKPVTTRHLAAALSEQHSLTKKQGLQMMEDLIGMITKHLKKGERVKISGLGILVVRKRAARMGRNPATGEAIKIKASRRSPSAPPKTSRWRSERASVGAARALPGNRRGSRFLAPGASIPIEWVWRLQDYERARRSHKEHGR